MFFKVLLLLFCANQPALADVRADIEARYAKTFHAASLKYRYGMYSHRAPDFTAVDADGLAWEPKREKAWMDNYLRRSLSVKETGKILKFRQLSASEVECEVLDHLEAVIVTDLAKRTKARASLTSRSLDRWKYHEGEWKLVRTQVLDQSYQETPISI